MRDFLAAEPSTSMQSEFPYVTILLLYRAGLHNEALVYCANSNLEEVRVFGEEIYQKCMKVYGGRLPQSELSSFMSLA